MRSFPQLKGISNENYECTEDLRAYCRMVGIG
ncbi:hypothetical protein PP744_gp062 [Rhizobium phage RHph_N38]|uniref:Uncharacterized protein n=1 Tax=Rhizobium phage RHph_N38 TaxID=2509750 RepID=A0A7S5R9J8_9CAUD|nr:hypothetical protein PP744_gp062 [Rhizobium phage RHph_N38]QIG70525.1 hypothetical protein EVB89_062 [Rhizobium phage RHph_N38]